MNPDEVLLRTYLEAVGMAQASGERVDLRLVAEEAGVSLEEVEDAAEHADGFGFVLGEDVEVPVLTSAGRQFLRLAFPLPRAVLTFLSDTIDDLHGRHALLVAGGLLIDDFRTAVLRGKAVEHARELVPPAFAPAIDERRALDLFAAANALLARLSSDHPAGCVAEEVLAVALIEEAQAVLEAKSDTEELDADTASTAAAELQGLFSLFQDDDTLALWDMAEPSDAVIASGELGVVDQRVEAWFTPFGWTAPTGYLDVPQP